MGRHGLCIWLCAALAPSFVHQAQPRTARTPRAAASELREETKMLRETLGSLTEDG